MTMYIEIREQEILVLPQTFFRVQKLEFVNEKHQYEIHLENIVLKKESIIIKIHDLSR